MKTRLARRSRTGRFLRIRGIRPRSRRRRSIVRRNPSTKHHSSAMRRKIGLAVKRAMARRRGSSGLVRRVRSSVTHARRRSSRPAMALAIRSPHRRRLSRRSMFGGSSIFSLVSKDTLMIAGGAVAASIGTGIVLNKLTFLPFMSATTAPKTREIARGAYSTLIPIGAAFLIRRKAPKVAEGLVIGGLIMGINSLIRSFAPTVGGTAIVQGPMGNFYEVGRSMGVSLAGEVPLTGGMSEYISGTNPGTVKNDLTTQVFPSSAW